MTRWCSQCAAGGDGADAYHADGRSCRHLCPHGTGFYVADGPRCCVRAADDARAKAAKAKADKARREQRA